eukprot:COSAG01_NODE_58662_length_304_cov_2.756098_1_plen_77_part_01
MPRCCALPLPCVLCDDVCQGGNINLGLTKYHREWCGLSAWCHACMRACTLCCAAGCRNSAALGLTPVVVAPGHKATI